MDLFLTRRIFVRGIYQRVPFISDPRVGFGVIYSEDLVVIGSLISLVMMVIYPSVPFISEP